MAQNLEAMINQISFDIVNQKIVDESQINKMLGVLVNDGVYAWWVYINDKLGLKSIDFLEIVFGANNLGSMFENYSIDKIKNITSEKKNKLNLTKESKKRKQIFIEWQKEISTNFFHKLSENLPDLLFFRDILEKILIYARYHAKTIGDGNE